MKNRRSVKCALQVSAFAFGLLASGNAFGFAVGLLGVVDPITGQLTGNVTGDLNSAARWDSVNRMDGVGTNRSLVGGLSYNFQGGSLANYFALFTWAAGSTLAQFQTAVNSAFDAWQSEDKNIKFTPGTVAVAAPTMATDNHVVGNEIDFFAQAALGASGLTFKYGVQDPVRLTNGYSNDGSGNFTPSDRIYASDIYINTVSGMGWTIGNWQDTFTHEIGHALGLGDVDVRDFIDSNANPGDGSDINEGGDVRVGLHTGPPLSVELATDAHILMCSDCPLVTTPSPDDVSGLHFLYPVDEPAGLGLFALAVLTLIGWKTRSYSAHLR